MARPTKQGIDYYPLDVQFDDKVELFIAETGAEGLGILITIWQLIYQNEGYYVQHNDDLILLIRRRIMADIDQISMVISCAISRGIFSESLHKKHKILTSSAIQKRYFIGAKKKKIVSVVKNYITIDVSDVGNLVYVDGNATKEEVKEKEEVEEEEDEKGKDTGGKPPKQPRFAKPSLQEVVEYCKERKNSISPERFIDYYESNGWRVGKNPMKDWKATVRTWETRNNDNPVPQPTRPRKELADPWKDK